MATFCSFADVVYKAGVGAATEASVAMINNFIEEAEGVIVATTRIGFLTSWAALNTNVQQLLTECASAHAAKALINYDTTGFYSRQAAEIALDVNDDNFKRSLKQLTDLDTNKIRSVPT